jgi:hypothetical protein
VYTIAAIIVVGVLASLYVYYHHSPTKTTSNQSLATSENTNSASNSNKTSSSPSSTLDSGSSSSSSPTTTQPTFTVQIVSATINSGNLHIGTLVSGTSSGTCSLSASQSGQSTLQLATSNVEQNVNSYDCGVFNIPSSTFPTSGNWQLKLTVDSNNVTSYGAYPIDVNQ